MLAILDYARTWGRELFELWVTSSRVNHIWMQEMRTFIIKQGALRRLYKKSKFT